MVFNFRKFLLYDQKLLTMGHGTKFKSTVSFHPMEKIHAQACCILQSNCRTVSQHCFNLSCFNCLGKILCQVWVSSVDAQIPERWWVLQWMESSFEVSNEPTICWIFTSSSFNYHTACFFHK